MTTVITRLYADTTKAESVANRLRWEGFPRNSVRVISADGGDEEAVKARLSRADVNEAIVGSYASHLAAGGAALVIQATYKPFGAARIAPRDRREKRRRGRGQRAQRLLHARSSRSRAERVEGPSTADDFAA